MNAPSTSVSDYKTVFQLFDTNGDEKISITELGTVLRTLYCNPTEEEIRKLMQRTDKDGKTVGGEINTLRADMIWEKMKIFGIPHLLTLRWLGHFKFFLVEGSWDVPKSALYP